MSTRSTISIHHTDGTVESVYCHFDGYYAHNGVILYNFYDTAEKVNELIQHGGISSLGVEIGEKHDFNKSHLYGGCTFYHRDRGEDLEIRKFTVHDKWCPYSDLSCEDYNYIFIESKNKWITKCESKWCDLKNELKESVIDEWIPSVCNREQYNKLCNFYNVFGYNVDMPSYEDALSTIDITPNF